MGLPAYVIRAEQFSLLTVMLSESGFEVKTVLGTSPLATQYFCRSTSSAEILVRFGTSESVLSGKIVVIMQPAKGWPWRLRIQERMMQDFAKVLKSYGVLSLKDATR